MAEYDPNIELNPNSVLIGALLLVLAGFGTVWMIIATGESGKAPAAQTAAP